MPAKLSISLGNLRYNIQNIRQRILKGQELLVMIKADAYGAGIVDVAKFLEKEKVTHFGVAYLKEALLLRKEGIKSQIIVFSGLVPNEYDTAINVDAIYSVSDIETLRILNEKAKSLNKSVDVEIAIDTGMTRLGFNSEDIQNLAICLKELTNVNVHGVYTHLSQADSNDEFTKKQIALFDNSINILKQNNIQLKYIHLCNSAGILKYNSDKYNLVRLGISAYGYLPDKRMQQVVSLKGIFKLTAPICNIRQVQADRQVSYSGTHITDGPTKIAVLQIGYADGLTRTLSNRYTVLVNGKEARIIGNICMDTCMIDVTNIPVKVGDEAVIFNYTDNKIDVLANMTDTIVYEVITNIGKRVDRQYLDE